MTKKILAILKSHHNSSLIDLHDCYKSYSMLKYAAYEYQRELQLMRDGFNFKIISYNGYMFSVGFYYRMDNELYFHYATNKTAFDFNVTDDDLIEVTGELPYRELCY